MGAEAVAATFPAVGAGLTVQLDETASGDPEKIKNAVISADVSSENSKADCAIIKAL